MPVFVGYVKAELDGVALAAVRTGPDAIFTIDVKNGMSDEVREGVTISRADEFELEGSRGVSNLVLRFADSTEKASCSLPTAAREPTAGSGRPPNFAKIPTGCSGPRPPHGAQKRHHDVWFPRRLTAEDFKTKFKKKKQALAEAPRVLTADDSGEWVPVVAFEGRGMDVVKLRLTADDVVVTSTGDAVFEDGVDLSDGDWADYDAEADVSVSITNAQTKVELVR